MECKVNNRIISIKRFPIRIVPEWNVKGLDDNLLKEHGCIRIVPEWNVKLVREPCRLTPCEIRIVPEWNVKLFFVLVIKGI